MNWSWSDVDGRYRPTPSLESPSRWRRWWLTVRWWLR